MEEATKKKVNSVLFGVIALIIVVVYLSKRETKKESAGKWEVQMLSYHGADAKWRQVGILERISTGEFFFGKSEDTPSGWGKDKSTMSGGLHAVSFYFPADSGEGFTVSIDKGIVMRNGTTVISRDMCAIPGSRRLAIDVNIAGKWYQLSNKHNDCDDVEGEIAVDDKVVEIKFSLTLSGEKFKGQGKFIKQ